MKQLSFFLLLSFLLSSGKGFSQNNKTDYLNGNTERINQVKVYFENESKNRQLQNSRIRFIQSIRMQLPLFDNRALIFVEYYNDGPDYLIGSFNYNCDYFMSDTDTRSTFSCSTYLDEDKRSGCNKLSDKIIEAALDRTLSWKLRYTPKHNNKQMRDVTITVAHLINGNYSFDTYKSKTPDIGYALGLDYPIY